MMIYKRYFKRPLDIIFSAIALIVLAPVFLIVAILVKINLGSQKILKKQRPGLNEKVFTIFKFRTMNNKQDQENQLLTDKERTTRFGKILRSTSIDELPELFNILIGDMSLVGPRPLLVQYIDFYNDSQKHRHDVRPGLTGLAQVSGRNSIEWDKRFLLDIKYVEKVRFLEDCKIIIKTIWKVINRNGIQHDSSDAVYLFEGEKNSRNQSNDS
jgi:undecaprenyl phosphate N,N'-diacetylbacillosamine 1-phosphate transferase